MKSFCKFCKILCLSLAIFSFIFSTASAETGFLRLDLNTSRYMSMPSPIKRIAIGNPEIATIVQIPSSNTEFLIVAHKMGTTTLFIWSTDNERFEYTIGVSPEDTGQAKLIQEAIGLPFVQVKLVDGKILLKGFVKDQYERNYAVQTAQLYIKGSSKNNISVGSNVNMSLQAQVADQTTEQTVGGASNDETGSIIDLLQMMNPTQIRLEAQVISINPEERSNLGFQYSGALNSGTTSATSAPGIFFGGEFFRDGNDSDASSHRNDYRNNISVALQALITKNKAKILSRPSVTTMSGEAAVIQVGGKIPYTTRDSDGPRTTFENYGIIMQFRPIVDAQNRIVSSIHVEISKPNGETVDGQPILEQRRTDSVVTVAPGMTMVIGGLMDSSESKTVSKIPFLGDIPIIGEFFKYTSKSKDKQELAVLITPYLVDDSNLSVTRMSQDMKDYYTKSQKEEQDRELVDVNKAENDESEPVNEVIAAPLSEESSDTLVDDDPLSHMANESETAVKSASDSEEVEEFPSNSLMMNDE